MSYDEIHEIKLAEIQVSEFNVRHENETQELSELAASIKKHGLLQPVVLMGVPGQPPYQLIAGQRRFLAHRKLRKTKIRAVFAGRINDEKAVLLSLVENIQSVKLNHADMVRAVTQLYEIYGKDERRVHEETGLSLRKVREFLSIQAQASPEMLKKLERNEVAPVDVKRVLIAAQGNIKKAEELLDLMGKEKLTRHEKTRVIEYGRQHPKATARKILTEAQKPRVEQKILVSLPDDIRDGLEKATKNLAREAEDIVTQVLGQWLEHQGFIK